ncbi:unnamed protein product, partial [Darwinula stevensoni]
MAAAMPVAVGARSLRGLLSSRSLGVFFTSVRGNKKPAFDFIPTNFTTLKERLEVEASKKYDPQVDYLVDISLPPEEKKPSRKAALTVKGHDSQELVRKLKNTKVDIPLEEVERDWKSSGWSQQVREVATHYDVFQHLFGDAYFYPRVPLHIRYDYDEEFYTPVHFGNAIKPKEACSVPHVRYEVEPGSLWTLVLTTPDGHFRDPQAEYLHWFVGNIPGDQIEKGEIICPYLQPFPARGLGFLRYVFILYKQESRLDYAAIKRPDPCSQLEERTFKTLDFYQERQDLITPAGLAFFQADWDPSLTDFFHQQLGMKEPVFEYDFPPPRMRHQEWFPHQQPFNSYLDRYRDRRDINKDIFLTRMKRVHPFKEEEPGLRYPLAQKVDSKLPSWLKMEQRKMKLKVAKLPLLKTMAVLFSLRPDKSLLDPKFDSYKLSLESLPTYEAEVKN